MRHTPGPWHCHFLGNIEEADDGGGLATGITTASIDEFNKEGDRGDLIAWVPHDRNEEANANLIAAAPDMLDVLRLVANSTSSGLRLCNCEGMADGFKCEDCLIWAAIDKAEGRVT